MDTEGNLKMPDNKANISTPDKSQAFVDLADASLRLGYNLGFISFLCESGKLKGAVKNEEVWQIPESTIKQFCEDNKLFLKTKDQIATGDFVDVEQAARLLGYGKRHLCRLCNSGAVLGAIKSGGYWQIPVSEIEKFQQTKPEKTYAKKIVKLLSPYVLLHCGEIGLKTRETTETLFALKSQLIIDDFDKKTIRDCELRLQGYIKYQEKVWGDLKACGFDEEIKNV